VPGGVDCVALSLIGSRVNKFLTALLGCLYFCAVGLPSSELPPPRERVEGACWGNNRDLGSPCPLLVVFPPSGLPSLEGRAEFCNKSGNHMAAVGWPDEDWRWHAILLSTLVRQAWFSLVLFLYGVLVGFEFRGVLLVTL
jgi:hypothetical protein